MKKLLNLAVISVLAFSGLLIQGASATLNISEDSLIKVKGRPDIYYYASDGKRYVFPNEKVYNSWFTSFNNITELPPTDISFIPLGGVVHYRPGILLVKIQTDPKVYAVSAGGVLRWVKIEQLAKKLYGDNWNKLIDDIPDSFFSNYIIGAPVESDDDYSPDEETNEAPSISHGRGLKLGHLKRGADTEKCRAIPATPAVPAHKQGKKGKATPAIPATPARDCAKQSHPADKTAPVISNIVASVSTSTAIITWLTNEPANSSVTYNTISLNIATTTNKTASSSNLVTSHSLALSGLTASTTHYYIVQSADGRGNTATSTERSFTTLPESVVDNTAPIISNVSATASSTQAIISWTTDELSTSIIQYALESLSTATTTQSLSNSAFVTSHSLALTGLTASTTYYYLVRSADYFGNTATSSEKTFTTLSL